MYNIYIYLNLNGNITWLKIKNIWIICLVTNFDKLYNLHIEGHILFHDALKHFFLWSYDVRHIVKNHLDNERGNQLYYFMGSSFSLGVRDLYVHHPTDRIVYSTAFVTPVVEQWLKQQTVQWFYLVGRNRWPTALWVDALQISCPSHTPTCYTSCGALAETRRVQWVHQVGLIRWPTALWVDAIQISCLSHTPTCYTSCGALAETRNSSMVPPGGINPMTHCTVSGCSTNQLPVPFPDLHKVTNRHSVLRKWPASISLIDGHPSSLIVSVN